MPAMKVHLDELISILLASTSLIVDGMSAGQIRDSIAQRLAGLDPDLTRRLFQLDEWQLDRLGEFVVDAHSLAKSWEALPPSGVTQDSSGDTRMD